MKWILFLRHWQLFLLLLFPSLVMSFLPQLYNSKFYHLFGIITPVLLFIWLYALAGLGLRSGWLVVGPALLYLTGFMLITVYADVQKLQVLSGLSLPIALTLTAILAFALMLLVIARGLARRGKELQISVGEAFPVFLMLFYFPIGLWFLQPRINRLAKAAEVRV